MMSLYFANISSLRNSESDKPILHRERKRTVEPAALRGGALNDLLKTRGVFSLPSQRELYLFVTTL
jgi:hypothetical protein